MSAETLHDQQYFNSMRFMFTDPKYEFREDKEGGRIVACNIQEENNPRRVAVAQPQAEGSVSLKFDPLLGSTLNADPEAKRFAAEMVLALQESQLIPTSDQAATVVEVDFPPVGVERDRTVALFNELGLPGVTFEPVEEGNVTPLAPLGRGGQTGDALVAAA